MSQKQALKLLTMSNHVPRVTQRKKTEIDKMVRDAATMRFWGLSFEQISRELKVSSRQARRYYDKFIEENKKDWLENKGRVLTEIHVGFKQAMAFAERKRQQAEKDKDQTMAGSWNKQVLESMGKYVGFLKDCGFVTQETVDGFAITADAKKTDIIGELVDGYQEYLKEVIENEAKSAGNPKAAVA